jgi:hypothetical protein
MQLFKRTYWRKLIYILLAFFLLADLSYSFLQHLNQTLDGDMPGGIVPAWDVKPVLSSPLGFRAVLKDTTYPNPNRFFSHWSFKKYFNHAPQLLQKFFHPVESVYLSAAIFKTALQILLLFILAAAVSGNLNIFRLRWMVSAAILAPLLQTNGYRHSMGIIDNSITYTFFYALPSALLILFLLPLVLKYIHKKDFSFNWHFIFLWIPLSFIVCLSGPLNAPALLVIILIFLIYRIHSAYKEQPFHTFPSGIKSAVLNIPTGYSILFIPASILSLWALFLSRYNSVDIANQIAVWISYSRLPAGLIHWLFESIGYPLLIVMLLINYWLTIRYGKNDEANTILKLYKWTVLFIIVYILLLPFGGYRVYRPNVIRFDSIMPVTIGLFFLYGISSVYLIKLLNGVKRNAYLFIIALVMFIYTLADKPKFHKNDCEKAALYQIAGSNELVVKLGYDCNVISWQRIEKPEDSELSAELLMIWRITDRKKLYYYEPR